MKTLMIFIASLTMVACSTGGRNKGDLNIYSVSQDTKLGAHWALYVQEHMPTLFDDRLNDYVNTLGQKLVHLYSNERLFDYQFKIVKESEVNAFALPGGYVYVTLGLLQVVESEAQLASVLGHEMGHILYRHGTEQLTKAQGFSCCLSVGAAAIGLGPTEVEIINLFGQTGLLYYGRSAEIEADHFGMEAIHKANYDVRHMAQFFEILSKIQRGNPTLLDKLLSTHPPIKDRIQMAHDEEHLYPHQENPIVSTPEFQIMKRHLQKYPIKYKPTELKDQMKHYLSQHAS